MKRAVWITGVPAAGKSALGQELVNAMKREFREPCALVDANVIRAQFWPYLGLSPEDRVVNVKGMAELAGVFVRAGSSVVVACIAPDREARNRALGLVRVAAQDVAVHQVHVDAPYEPPSPEEALFVDSSKLSVGDAAQQILAYLEQTPPRAWA